ncbi:vacuolar DHA amino acid exporter [Polyporus arcularius HHB13444]|uniref:Vacuolar DHA amino acid exporter n=1 Tax=Polyporus arcularius HHB13444 TaxID=1314778 RepID=A0A5C3NXS6_9APHY|nr:vacuolar DHA amino acid exporter [Polyporus arcularius HHB13444]
MSDKQQAAVAAAPVPALAAVPALDIEHARVADDPRAWSNARKLSVVATVSAASMINGLGTNIYNPAISQIEQELNASSSSLALSLSLYILIQGGVPLLWSTLSEFWGRKNVYLVSAALGVVGCIVAALAQNVNVLIGMRCIQALGSSAVTALGAATLSDIYEPEQRGTMMGIYYSAPLLGPSIGPLLGGVLTQAFSWRATFWFLAIFIGICFLPFIPFKDTFRRERSLTYQAALKRRRAYLSAKASETSSISQVTAVSRVVSPTTVGQDTPDTASAQGQSKDAGQVVELACDQDLEKQQAQQRARVAEPEAAPMEDIKLSLADVNPAKPIIHVLRRMNNLVILVTSGLIFGFTYCVSYTCSRTLANTYGYNALQIGLVLLAFGVGSLVGSVFGGRYSDHVFRTLRARNGGTSQPEMRLESTMVFMPFFPASVIAYGWVCERHVNVAAICVMLFLSGLFSICIYTSTLSYVVDANNGRSSSAVATNSAFRGGTAFIAAEVAVPLQNAIGDGGMYSLWAGLIFLSELLILLVWWKGGAWRAKWELKEQGDRGP